MGLLATLAKAQPTHPFDKVARQLADSDTDLTDIDGVTTWLVENHFMPWNISAPDDGRRVTEITLLCEAWNLRTLRQMRNKALPFTKLPEPLQ